MKKNADGPDRAQEFLVARKQLERDISPVLRRVPDEVNLEDIKMELIDVEGMASPYYSIRNDACEYKKIRPYAGSDGTFFVVGHEKHFEAMRKKEIERREKEGQS